MSHRSATPIRTAPASENASPLQASKENANANSTPKHRKPLGDKNANTTPTHIPPSLKLEPRIGHRAEKHNDKFTSIRPPEPLHLNTRALKKQGHGKVQRDSSMPKNIVFSDENTVLPPAPKPKKHSVRASPSVSSPDSAFSIWVDEKPSKSNEIKNAKQKLSRVDQENVLPSKEPIASVSRGRTQRVHPEKKKVSRMPLTEIDVHDLPEYQEFLRDGSPTPTTHNVSSHSLRSPTWSDSEAVLSQALEQAESTARSLISEIKSTEEDETELDAVIVPKHTIVPQPAEDVFTVVTTQITKETTTTETATGTDVETKATREVKAIRQTKDMRETKSMKEEAKAMKEAAKAMKESKDITETITITETKTATENKAETKNMAPMETKPKHKRTSDEADESDESKSATKAENDSIKKRLRPRRR
ncbi:hypothetical protein Unana1_08776 [Umbelopsis nana]